MGRCRAIGCDTKVSDRFFMCSKHWRLVPPELKHAFRQSVQDLAADRSGSVERARAFLGNMAEIARIVHAIEQSTT